MRNDTPGDLEKLLENDYSFLVTDYGFTIRKTEENSYFAETSNVRVKIFVEYSSFVVSIEPIGETANELLRKNILPRARGAIAICKCLVPNFTYNIDYVDESDLIQNIPVESKKQASLLKQYCSKILRGCVSEWLRVVNCVSQR